MAKTKLSKLEYQIMDALWARGESAIREIQESFPAVRRPAYTTIRPPCIGWRRNRSSGA